MWVGLRSLTTLSIMYTRVVEIDSCGFSHLPKLEILKIDVVQTTVLNYVLLDKSTFPDTPKQPKLQIEQDAPSMTCDPSLCWLKAAEQKALIANYTRNGTRVIPKCADYNDAPWTEVREMMHCNLTGNKIVGFRIITWKSSNNCALEEKHFAKKLNNFSFNFPFLQCCTRHSLLLE